MRMGGTEQKDKSVRDKMEGQRKETKGGGDKTKGQIEGQNGGTEQRDKAKGHKGGTNQKDKI